MSEYLFSSREMADCLPPVDEEAVEVRVVGVLSLSKSRSRRCVVVSVKIQFRIQLGLMEKESA